MQNFSWLFDNLCWLLWDEHISEMIKKLYSYEQVCKTLVGCLITLVGCCGVENISDMYA